MKIRIMPFLSKKGNRVAKGAIEFSDGILAGYMLMGFTICDDKEKGLFVQFPSAPTRNPDGTPGKPFYFLRASVPELVDKLESSILDVYDSMTGAFNTPRIKGE